MDTSTPAVSVGWRELGSAPTEERVGGWFGAQADEQASRSAIANNQHGELLAPLIEEALAAAGRVTGDAGAVVVGLGPGPFTGLRVGIVTAAVIADALRVPVYGVCSLDAISPQRTRRPYAVATDARRKQVYWATYDGQGRRNDGPSIGVPGVVATRLKDLGVTTLLGPGAWLYPEAFSDFEVDSRPAHPQPLRLIERAEPKLLAGAPSDPLTPLYLKRPDATPPGPRKKVTPV